MVIFHSHVKLPEGIFVENVWDRLHPVRETSTPLRARLLCSRPPYFGAVIEPLSSCDTPTGFSHRHPSDKCAINPMFILSPKVRTCSPNDTFVIIMSLIYELLVGGFNMSQLG